MRWTVYLQAACQATWRWSTRSSPASAWIRLRWVSSHSCGGIHLRKQCDWFFPITQSWKRQWCILRPSWTRAGGGCLAVYCSEAGTAAGALELPPGSCVRRAKSRSKPHAFAVFAPDDPRKPRVLLAASSSHDAQLWMDKIKNLLNNNSTIREFLRLPSYLPLSWKLSQSCTHRSDFSLRCNSTVYYN